MRGCTCTSGPEPHLPARENVQFGGSYRSCCCFKVFRRVFAPTRLVSRGTCFEEMDKTQRFGSGGYNTEPSPSGAAWFAPNDNTRLGAVRRRYRSGSTSCASYPACVCGSCRVTPVLTFRPPFLSCCVGGAQAAVNIHALTERHTTDDLGETIKGWLGQASSGRRKDEEGTRKEEP